MSIQQNIKVAVDAILFGYKESTLYILLIQQKFGPFKDQWALPGGFVKDGESLKEAVHRELKEETGVRLKFLEQLYTFGDDVNRDPRGQVISVSYFGTVNPDDMELHPTTDAKAAQWFPIQEIPPLAFDHAQILEVAQARLKAKLNYQPIGFDLLQDKFPFSDLEQLYMTILNRNIDRRNFRKKLLSFGFLEETGDIQKIGSGRPAKLFRFNTHKYKQLQKEGIHFEIKFA